MDDEEYFISGDKGRVIIMNGEEFFISSDNVFADLGMPNAEELLLQSDLLCDIVMEISRRKLKRRQVASLLGLSQADVTNLLAARLSRFSFERLQEMSAKLGMNVAIS
jgi:predicted XRE-type DNA-binding protein